MRVAFDIRPLQYPGAHRGIARYVGNLLQAMQQFTSQVQLSLLLDASRRIPDWLDPELPACYASTWRPPVRQIGFLYDELMSSRWSRLPVDLIHVTSNFDLSFNWPTSCRLPICSTLYDLFALTLPLRGYRKLATPVYHWLAWKLKRCQGILSISNLSSEICQRYSGLAPDKFYLTPPGVHPAKTSPTTREDFVLLFPCWPAHKNVLAVVQALAPLGSSAPPLVLAGALPDSLRQEIVSSGTDLDLTFVGHVSDEQITDLYSRCSSYCFPSLCEGFGLTPLEAMAHGAAVSCSDVRPINEVAQEAALLFNPEDPESIREAVMQLSANPESRHHFENRSLIRAQQYSWERCAQLTIAAYRDCLR